jgi:hypothetical protein
VQPRSAHVFVGNEANAASLAMAIATKSNSDVIGIYTWSSVEPDGYVGAPVSQN